MYNSSSILTMKIFLNRASVLKEALRIMRRLYNSKVLLMVFLISAICGRAAGQEKESRLISLDDAVNMALSNHPSAKNAALEVEKATIRKSGSFKLDPAQITWEHGQINSPENDDYFLISQNLGSPFTHVQLNRFSKNELDLASTSLKISQKQLIATVKEAYFIWVHQFSANKLIEEEATYYDHFFETMKLRFERGDSNLLEKTMVEVKYAETQRKLLIAQENLKVVTNNLNKNIYSEGPYLPKSAELELYSIHFPAGQADKFYPYTFIDFFEQEVKQKNLEVGIQKSYLSPQISAGYFRQRIASYKNLNGFQIGLSVPLWFRTQVSGIKEAQLNREIAMNDVTLRTYELEQTIDNLKIKLDQEFINIQYFREVALNQAELLIKLATLKLQNEEIKYIEYLQSLSEAIKIKETYLQSILNYNLLAVKLEYYLN